MVMHLASRIYKEQSSLVCAHLHVIHTQKRPAASSAPPPVDCVLYKHKHKPKRKLHVQKSVAVGRQCKSQDSRNALLSQV